MGFLGNMVTGVKKLLNPASSSKPDTPLTPEASNPAPAANPGVQEGKVTEPLEQPAVAETVTTTPPEQPLQPVAVEKPGAGLGATTETEVGGTNQPNVEGATPQAEGEASSPQTPGTGETLP